MKINNYRVHLVALGLFIMSQIAIGQQVISLWEGQAPGNIQTQVKEEYKISDWGSEIVTGISVPSIAFYESDKEGRLPAVVICPGGGYGVEAYDHEGNRVAKWLNSLGYHAFVLKYRLPDESICTNCEWVPLLDAQKAISLVRTNCDEWMVNPQKIGIMGFSAGGHLAASVSNVSFNLIGDRKSSSQVRPDFSILMYPVISMDSTITHMGSRKALIGIEPSNELINQFSMELQVTDQTPPTFILHASDDGAVPVANTNRYAQAMEKAGVPCRKIVFEHGGHGFGFRPELPSFIWTQHLTDWLNENSIK